jgi:ribosomal protein S1
LENPTSALKIGEVIEAKVLDLDVEKEKMTLSIKALLPEPEVKKTNPNKPQRKEAEDAFNKEAASE